MPRSLFAPGGDSAATRRRPPQGKPSRTGRRGQAGRVRVRPEAGGPASDRGPQRAAAPTASTGVTSADSGTRSNSNCRASAHSWVWAR